MASIGNYAAALAEAARNAARGSATGIGAAIRGSATSEMPGVTGAYSFAQSLRNSANSRAGSSGGGKGGGGGSASSSGPSDSSNFNTAVVRELQLMNANILEQTRLLRYQVDSNRSKSQFDEENAREQALRDSRLLDAINNIGASSGGGPAGGGGDNNGKGLLDNLGGIGGGGGGGRGGKGRRGSIKGRLVKGAGIAGLGLGALYAYNRVANGGESISEVAKDMAPGVLGSTIGGLVGMIGGPIGAAIGAAVGGAIGDSDFGHKMFEKVLPKFQELGDTIAGKFNVLQNWFSNFDVGAMASGAYKSVVSGAKAVGNAASDVASSAYKSVSSGVSSAASSVKNYVTGSATSGTSANKVITFGSLSREQQDAVLAEQRRQEGFKPGMLTYDLNNPGAMLYDKMTAKFGAVPDDTGRGVDKLKGKFAKFPTLEQGIEAQRYKWLNGQGGKYASLPLNQALQLWITGKVEGTGGSHLGSRYENYINKVYAAAGSTPPITPSTVLASAKETYENVKTGAGSILETAKANVDPAVQILGQKLEEVRKEIRKASNVAVGVATAIGKDTVNNFKSLARSSARTANAVAPPNKPIRPILKTPEQIIAETNKNFAMQFQKIAPKAISLALRQTLFPKGIGVTQQAAGGALFRGQQLNNIFGVGKSVSKLATSLFGKQYGGMLAPALNNLATGYLEAGARAGGRLLFGMIGGMGAEQSNILTGQILGNYARGNKKLAVEQLLYGTTGVASGYETVFAKYGFKNPMEGINYMANTLGAAVSDPVNSLMNPGAKPTEYIDPRTGKKVSLNSATSFSKDAYGRIDDISSTGATIQTVPGGDKAILSVDPTLNKLTEQQVDLQKQLIDQQQVDAVRRATDAAEAKAVSVQGDQGIIGKLQELITEISTGRVGSGSTAGGSLAVPGFFNPKNPLGQVGNMALDLGRVAATSAIYKGLGGKGTNPYTAALANFAISSALKYGGQLAYQYAAPYLAAAGNALVSGAQMAGGYVLNAAGLTGYSATNVAAPIVSGVSTTTASTAATSAAGTTGTISEVLGPTAAASSLASSGAASYAGGLSAGTTIGFEGSIGAIGGSAAGTGFLAGASEFIPIIGALVVGYNIGKTIARWLGFGGNDEPQYQPTPILERILYTSKNNNITQISTIYTKELNYLPSGQPAVWAAICDQLLRIAFNAVKAMEVKRRQIGKPATNPGFDYLGAHVSSNRVSIYFYKGEPTSPLPNNTEGNNSYLTGNDFGTLEEFSKKDANSIARQIIELVGWIYRGEFESGPRDENIRTEVAKTVEALQKLNYKTLGSGLLSATADQLDTSITKFNYIKPVFYDKTDEQYIYDTQVASKLAAGHDIARTVYNAQTGTYVGGAPANVFGYDSFGRPIYDLNNDNMINDADFKTSLADIQKIIPTATATNVGNLGSYVSSNSAYPDYILRGSTATSGSSGASGGSTVVAGNNSNNTTNNTTVVRQVSSVDVLRGMTTQTALPVTG